MTRSGTMTLGSIARRETGLESLQARGGEIAGAGQGLCVRVTAQPSSDEVAAWDRFVDSVPFADVTQLSAWSKVRSGAGFSPYYVFIERDGRLVGGAQILRRSFPLVGSLGYLSAGPVIADGIDGRAEIVEALASTLREILGHKNRVLFVQPPVGANDLSAELRRRGFRLSQAGIAPGASLRIDLSADEDAIRARLSKRLRYWTRQWPKRGVSVRVGGESDLPLLADFLARSAAFQGYRPLSLDYLQQLYGSLEANRNAVLFVGQVGDAPAAVGLYTRCGGVLRERLIGFDRESDTTNLRVPAALKWHAILWAREQGLSWFDFGGIRVETAEALLAGRTLDQETAGGSDFFKMSFGGDAFLMPEAVEDA